MLRKILTYGTVSGLLVGAMMAVTTTTMSDHATYGMLVGYLTMLIALSLVFLGVKRHRDADLGGVIRFWPAFGMGLGISLIASVFYVLAWEATVAVLHLDFANSYANAVIEKQKAAGVSGEALARLVAEMEHFKTMYADPLYRLPMTFAEIFPVGALVSLLSAVLLRNSRILPARRA